MTQFRGFMDEDLTPLTASQLANALLRGVEVYGDLPVQMAAWGDGTGDLNDAAAYVWAYGKRGVKPSEAGPAYFYIHGVQVDTKERG